MAKTYHTKRTVPFNFGDKHKEYIRNCENNIYNFAEGAVRAGKTVDNVYAFAHSLKTHPDKIHLATGSTAANAKLNIGDANGFGLEAIFRGQCKWGKYKGNECLNIKGPSTGYRQKVVIFAGAALANSFKKIRGNSYGMWIATEVNLHHDNTIKEAFNRLLASHDRKIFWDLNPDHPKAPIYTDYIEKYRKRAETGELKGGVNYQHFTIFDNINISKESREAFISQYTPGTIWYNRDILGIRCIAEGLIYRSLAAEQSETDPNKKPHLIQSDDLKASDFMRINIGIDFGGNGSGHTWICTGITRGYGKLVALYSKKVENDKDDISPEELNQITIQFVEMVLKRFKKVTAIYPDSAETVLIRGIRRAMKESGHGSIPVVNALKKPINDRIDTLAVLLSQDRFFYTEHCDTLLEALATAVWDDKQLEKVRLDNGTSDIDSLDAFEYTYERFMKSLVPTFGKKKEGRE